MHGDVPFLVQGSGVEADEFLQFNERNTLQSKLVFEEGYRWMGHFLK